MAGLYPELETAVSETLATAADQTPEFKRRLRKLVENATRGNLADADVCEVIELVSISEELMD